MPAAELWNPFQGKERKRAVGRDSYRMGRLSADFEPVVNSLTRDRNTPLLLDENASLLPRSMAQSLGDDRYQFSSVHSQEVRGHSAVFWSKQLPAPNTNRGPVHIFSNPGNSQAGTVTGLRIMTATAELSAPAAGDFVATYTYIDSLNGRTRIWGENILAVVGTADAYANGIEINIENDGSDVASKADLSAPAAKHKAGLLISKGASAYPGTAGVLIDGIRSDGVHWHKGVEISGTTDVGVEIGSRGSNTSTDVFPTTGVKINKPLGSGCIVAKLKDNSGVNGVVVERFTDSSPSGTPFLLKNAANSQNLYYVDINGGVNAAAYLGTGSDAAALIKRIKATQATALVAGDFALSGGWGATAAVSAVTGTDQGWQMTVTANGAGVAANPTITLTFKDGTWTNAPIGLSKMIGGTGAITDLTDAPTATTWVITFNGTPVAGSTYQIAGIAMGR